MKTLPPPSIKQRMLQGIQAAAVHARLCRPERAGGRATVLRYQSVADGPIERYVDPARHLSPGEFERHCSLLAAKRNVVSLSSLVERVKRQVPPTPGSVAISFDFGYLDNLTIAAPILARYDLPATFFLATDYVEDGREHWGDRLYNIFRMRRHQVLEFEGQSFALTRSAQARAAYLLLCRELEQLPSRRVRDVWLDQIEDNLGAAVRVPKLTLDWEAVQGLCELSPRFEVAALGAGQIDLTAHPEEVVRDDVLRCVQAIDAHTGAGPQHFGFPFGRCNRALRNLLLELGLKSGSLDGGSAGLQRASDVFAIPRRDARLSVTQLAFFTAGGWESTPSTSVRAA